MCVVVSPPEFQCQVIEGSIFCHEWSYVNSPKIRSIMHSVGPISFKVSSAEEQEKIIKHHLQNVWPLHHLNSCLKDFQKSETSPSQRAQLKNFFKNIWFLFWKDRIQPPICHHTDHLFVSFYQRPWWQRTPLSHWRLFGGFCTLTPHLPKNPYIATFQIHSNPKVETTQISKTSQITSSSFGCGCMPKHP